MGNGLLQSGTSIGAVLGAADHARPVNRRRGKLASGLRDRRRDRNPLGRGLVRDGAAW